MTLMTVQRLTVSVESGDGRKELLSDVSFTVPESSIVGMVGESGSGKSVTSLAIMGLLPHSVRADSGYIQMSDRPVLTGGKHTGSAGIAMVFQNPRAALNPTMRVGRQLGRAIRIGENPTRRTIARRTDELLRQVGIHDTKRVAGAYPHQLSGGMCQRVMIAMALAIKPRLLIADEPTTGLDVTVQAQILELLKQLAAQVDCSVLLITHDLSVVATICDSLVVMYNGQVRETGPTVDVFENPQDDYTRYLLSSLNDDLDTIPEIKPSFTVLEKPPGESPCTSDPIGSDRG